MSRPSVELYKRDHPDSAKVVEYADGDPYQFGYHLGVADAGAGFAPLGPLDEDSFFLVGPTLAGYRDGYGDYQAELEGVRFRPGPPPAVPLRITRAGLLDQARSSGKISQKQCHTSSLLCVIPTEGKYP